MPCWPPEPAPKNATLLPLMIGLGGMPGCMNDVNVPVPPGIAVDVSAIRTGFPGMTGSRGIET